MKDAELDVGGDSGPWVGEDGEKVRSRGLDESPRHEPPDWMTFQELLESRLGVAVVGGVDEASHIEPRAGAEVGILRVEVDLRELPAQDGLDLGIILGLEEFLSLDLVLGAKALPGSSSAILRVIGAV